MSNFARGGFVPQNSYNSECIRIPEGEFIVANPNEVNWKDGKCTININVAYRPENEKIFKMIREFLKKDTYEDKIRKRLESI